MSISIRVVGERKAVGLLETPGHLMMATLTVEDAKLVKGEQEKDERPPMDLVCVLDTSGSMQGDRIALVKSTMLFLIDKLAPEDRLSVVSFSDWVQDVLGELTFMDERGKRNAKVLIQSLRAGGGTNLCGGLVRGVKKARSARREENSAKRLRSVMLFTDGQANRGPQDPYEICKEMRNPMSNTDTMSNVDKYTTPNCGVFSQYATPARRTSRSIQSSFRAVGSSPTSVTYEGCTTLGGVLRVLLQKMRAEDRHSSFLMPVDGGLVKGYYDVIKKPMDYTTMDGKRRRGEYAESKEGLRAFQSDAELVFSNAMLFHAHGGRVQAEAIRQRAAFARAFEGAAKVYASLKEDGGAGAGGKGRHILPCTVHTFGFGINHNAGLLQKVAAQGGGQYYYVESSQQIMMTFADCLGGLASTVAQNVRLRILPVHPTHSGVGAIELANQAGQAPMVSKVYAGKQYALSSTNGVYEVRLGDLQQGEQRDILFRMELPKVGHAWASSPCVKAEVLFDGVDGEPGSTSALGTVSRQEGVKLAPREIKVDEQMNRVLAAQSIEKGVELAGRGRLAEARAALSDGAKALAKSVSKSTTMTKGLIADLERISQSLQDQRSYQLRGDKMMNCQMMAHRKQRGCSAAAEDEGDQQWASEQMYAAKSTRSYKLNFKKAAAKKQSKSVFGLFK